jgi:hypothetical protein
MSKVLFELITLGSILEKGGLVWLNTSFYLAIRRQS